MSPIEKFLLVFVIPVLLAASLVEGVILSWRRHYDWRATGASLVNWVVRDLVTLFLPLSLATPVFRWAWQHRVITVPMDHWQSYVLLFLGVDFFYYWFHRASHRIRWFWGNHAVHHSANELTISAGYRIGIFGKLIGAGIFFAPLVWLGFPPRVVLTAVIVNLLYQSWIHTTWIPKLGWLEYLLNTPSAHRVHHASNPEYIDKNFGGVLILFDRLFGTYAAERDDIPCRYGLVEPITSYNPLRIELAEWAKLLKDLRRAGSVKVFLGHLVMPPDWKPGTGKSMISVSTESQAR